jgi:hypothetical protein
LFFLSWLLVFQTGLVDHKQPYIFHFGWQPIPDASAEFINSQLPNWISHSKIFLSFGYFMLIF